MKVFFLLCFTFVIFYQQCIFIIYFNVINNIELLFFNNPHFGFYGNGCYVVDYMYSIYHLCDILIVVVNVAVTNYR